MMNQQLTSSQLNSRGPFWTQLNAATVRQLFSFLLSSTAIVKAMCACVLLGYLLSLRSELVPYLAIVPGKLLPPNFYAWTLLTHSFVEYHLVELVADCFVVLLYSKMLEPLWGPLECVRFYLITTVLVGFTTAFIYFVVFACTFDELVLFNISIHGLGGLYGGFSVAVKQIMPDTVLLHAGFVRLKQDHLPLLVILGALVLHVARITQLTYVLMVTWGVLIGWCYLRFFQKHKNGTRGDSSSTFVFASLFPGQIQPFVAILANTIFNVLVRLKICKPAPKRYNVASSSSAGHHHGGSGGSQSHITITIPLVNQEPNPDAERRRLKALKALKERLKKPDEEETKLLWSEGSGAKSSGAETSAMTLSTTDGGDAAAAAVLSDSNQTANKTAAPIIQTNVNENQIS